MTVRRQVLAVAIAVLGALAAPAVASAGGWATVALDQPPPTLRAGQPWDAELTILQHGRTPLEGVTPTVLLRPAAGGAERRFTATPTGRPGVYRARVVVPAAGTWAYGVDDGFTARHALGRLRVAAEEAVVARSDGGGTAWWLAGTAIAGVAAVALGAALLAARRRHTPGRALPG